MGRHMCKPPSCCLGILVVRTLEGQKHMVSVGSPGGPPLCLGCPAAELLRRQRRAVAMCRKRGVIIALPHLMSVS